MVGDDTDNVRSQSLPCLNFYNLPHELRDQVYSHVFDSTKTYRWNYQQMTMAKIERDDTILNLSLSSKQIYAETINYKFKSIRLMLFPLKPDRRIPMLSPLSLFDKITHLSLSYATAALVQRWPKFSAITEVELVIEPPFGSEPICEALLGKSSSEPSIEDVCSFHMQASGPINIPTLVMMRPLVEAVPKYTTIVERLEYYLGLWTCHEHWRNSFARYLWQVTVRIYHSEPMTHFIVPTKCVSQFKASEVPDKLMSECFPDGPAHKKHKGDGMEILLLDFPHLWREQQYWL